MLHGTVVALAIGLSTGAPPVPVPAAPIVQASCPDGGGSCYYQGTVYVEPGAPKFTLWHERAHALDAERLTDTDRNTLTSMLKMHGEWNQGTGMGTRSPSEVFADAYAACALGRQVQPQRHGRLFVSKWETSYGYNPTVRQHRRVCSTLAQVR
jgi:hypothetical protein